MARNGVTMALLAQNGVSTSTVSKISGVVDNVPNYPLTASNLTPIINHRFEVFGPERVIFAGDWPVYL